VEAGAFPLVVRDYIGRQSLALLSALALDAAFGEPPSAAHPVVWMGRALDWLERLAPGPERTTARLGFGASAALGLPVLWGSLGFLVERSGPWWLLATALKTTLAGRALLEAGARVEAALANGRQEEARAALGWLVSRPTGTLNGSSIAAAAIESLAENFVDSWLAPLLAYTVGGLPAAFAYRAANTADAMWGYRSARYEHLGKVAARLDDALNWVPARMGALTLALSSGRPHALAIWRTDAHRTASPNAGQTMAVAAGALGVRLEKVDHYVLNETGALPTAADVARARRLVRTAMAVSAAAALALRWMLERAGGDGR
jgi:adenosylcobinamide-phosphate synthase